MWWSSAHSNWHPLLLPKLPSMCSSKFILDYERSLFLVCHFSCCVVNTSCCILFATFWKIPFAWSSCLILFHIHIDMRECHFPVHIRMHMTSCLFWIVFGLLWEAWDCWLLTCNGSSHSVLICFIWHDSLNDSIFILNCQGIPPLRFNSAIDMANDILVEAFREVVFV